MKFMLIMTIGVKELIDRKVLTEDDLILSLNKFICNDWGILCDEDKELQDELLKNPKSKYNERFMGVYKIKDNEIWYIREYDCSVDSLLITILLPEEY